MKTMKTIVLLIATGVFSFLMGVTVCYFWFQSQLQNQRASAPEQSVSDTGMAGAPAETIPEGAARTENQSTRATRFEMFDADKDGRLSLAEFAGTRKPAEAEKWFKLRDANNDGFLSREEFMPTSAAKVR